MKTSRKLLVLSAAIALGLSPLACHSSFETAAPKSFVELPDQDRYDFRATTPDGLVVAVRTIDHEPESSGDFWSRALEISMRQRGGYALLGQQDLSLDNGLHGKQLRFGHDEGKQPHLYYVSLVVSDDALYLLEVGGKKAQVEAQDALIAQWVQSFRPTRCFAFACRDLSPSDQPKS